MPCSFVYPEVPVLPGHWQKRWVVGWETFLQLLALIQLPLMGPPPEEMVPRHFLVCMSSVVHFSTPEP